MFLLSSCKGGLQQCCCLLCVPVAVTPVLAVAAHGHWYV